MTKLWTLLYLSQFGCISDILSNNKLLRDILHKLSMEQVSCPAHGIYVRERTQVMPACDILSERICTHRTSLACFDVDI
jgi:hypothetical protein